MKHIVLTTFILSSPVILSACEGCSKSNSSQTETTQQGASTEPTQAPATPVAATGGKLEIEELEVGKGDEAVPGKRVTVHYVGTLTDGKKFDSSRDNMAPFIFHLGAGQVIPGWEEGIRGMKVGGKRKLTVPPQMAYGERGINNVIPPNATLLFEVELLKVE